MKHVMRKAVPGSVHKVRFNKNACGAALALALCSTAGAAELTFGTLDSGLGDGKQWSLGPATVTVKGAVSAGMVVRTDTPHYSSGDGMNTQNDGELNYDKGDTASQALEAYLQADIKVDDAGLFVSGKGWYDYALKHDNVAHGSVANGYSANSPLSDNGFVPLDRFSNAVLDDLYVYNTFHFGDQSLLVRLGNQEIPWVTPTTIGGGIQQINSIDYSALSRASSIAEEAAVPAPTLYARYTVNPALSFDAFYIFRFEPNAYPGCGTFWSTSDYAQQGCDKMTLNGALLSAITHKSVSTTDAQSITNPLDYVARGADKKSNKGQYGGSVSVMFDNVGLFGLYYAHYSSRSAVTGDVRTGAGVLTPTAANLGLATPTGIASYYERIYPTDIDMFALNFKTRLPDGTGVYSEFSYRPNQPIAWNGSDFISGLLAGTGPLAWLAKTPVGYEARGYDNFKVAQWNIGAAKPLGDWYGGKLSLSGETAIKYVAGLPDSYVMRYGRVGFGVAPSSTSSGCSGSALTCSLNGFVTTSSWGARAKLDDKFNNVLNGLDLDASVAMGYDIHGYSYDGIFSQGRRTALFNLHALWQRTYTADLTWLRTGGGDYNIVDDRSFAMASVGARF